LGFELLVAKKNSVPRDKIRCQAYFERVDCSRSAGMRIVFLEVDTERAWAVASIGPAFIGAYLRAHGHDVGFVRAHLDAADADVLRDVAAARPDILGISVTTRQWLRARNLVQAIRQKLDVPVIAGGLHATFAPEVILASPGFDYVCLGEGEQPMLDLVQALESGSRTDSIANIWKKDTRSRPELRAPLAPLDRLPFMARDLLDEPSGTVHMATQRGCPFPCTYCAARMYNELYAAGGEDYGRRRSHANVLAELHELRDADRLGYVIFLDDTFTINHSWVMEFCRLYGAELHAPFSLHARVETVNEKLLHMLADAGCHQITYGVESGSERVRRGIMHRQVTNQRFKDVFRWTREAGIMLTANFMLGLPGETRDDLEQTLELAEELNVADFGYFVFYPYPGTRLFSDCLERGYLPADYLQRPANHRESILNLPDLSRDDIAEFYDRFTALRQRLHVARYGQALPQAVASVAQAASTG
jgi:anaerobic magnesium-protoporphyrin IX monomethyl ester cyclase